MTMIFDRLDRDFQVGLKLLNYLWAGLTLSLANPIDLVRFRMQTMP